MYGPTYEKVVMVVAALIFRLSYVRGTSRETVDYAGKAQVPDHHPVSAHGIWYSLLSESEYKQAKFLSRLELPAFCKYIKDAISKYGGVWHVASALWYLSLDESKFAQFRAQMLDIHDKELEDVVAKSMIVMVKRILWRFGSFRIGCRHDDEVLIYRVCCDFSSEKDRNVHFEVSDLGNLCDIVSLTILTPDGSGTADVEYVWIHQVWHALRIMLPALKNLHLTKRLAGNWRDLTVDEIKSAGCCVGVERFELTSCVGSGLMKHLEGSTVANSVKFFILGDWKLENSDLDAIANFNMHEMLLSHHAPADAHDPGLARILGHRKFAGHLTKLCIMSRENTHISAGEAAAIADLENISGLSLIFKKSECMGWLSRMLENKPISAGLRSLSLVFSAVSPSDIDAVAGLGGLESLSLACDDITSEHLSRLCAGPAALSITKLMLKGVDVSTALPRLAAFKSLSELLLEQYTASAGWASGLSTLPVECRRLKKLSLASKQLLSPLAGLLAAKQRSRGACSCR